MEDKETSDVGKNASVSRRGFLRGVGVGVAGVVAAGPTTLLEQACSAAAPPPEPVATFAQTAPDAIPITLHVNGQSHQLRLEPRTTLADALRYEMGLTGTKIVCDRGSCGACTVIANGRTVYSCMMLAVDAQGKQIRTVESFAHEGKLSPLQEAFVHEDALMCGFCTPGFVVSCTALLERTPHPTLEQVKEGVRGNLCRCGTYPRIFQACLSASRVQTG